MHYITCKVRTRRVQTQFLSGLRWLDGVADAADPCAERSSGDDHHDSCDREREASTDLGEIAPRGTAEPKKSPAISANKFWATS